MNNQTNKIKYKLLAPVYDSVMGNHLMTEAREKALNLLHLEQGERVLLVGVGTGEDLPFLPDSVEVVGIDISDEMLEIAKEKVQGRSVQLLNMDAERLAFPDESFDVVILDLILSVVENPKTAMSEAIRVLKKEGRILVFDKFLDDTEEPSVARRVLNVITSFIGTDINRHFGEIVEGLPVHEIYEEPSLFQGSYRIIILKPD